ncbi:MAG: ROK family protein [Bacteroidales bacterium]|nr:ROK family protein [Bacteroidales bacterium]
MKKILCGVDIGGTKLSVALVTTEGEIIDKCIDCGHVDKTEGGMVDQIKETIKTILNKSKLDESDLLGIGIGCAGHIRFRDGVIITTSNLKGYKNYPLRDAVQAGFKVPVILDNDANAQAYGEYKFGAGKGFNDMVFLTISTGIGAGIIINKQLYRGVTGTAGEFGHTIIEPDSELKCTCGNNGCLMAVACGMALPYLYKQKLDNGMVTTLQLSPGFDYKKVDGKLLKLGLDIDDPVSKAIILDSGRYLGIGLYNIFQALNPPLIVLGGGLLSWGDFYLDQIRKTFYDLAGDMIFDPIEIKVSDIGPDAGVIGAASLALELC